MTGSLQVKKGYYYVVLSYKDFKQVSKTKWVSTKLEVKNNKRKAEALINETIRKYSYLENALEENEEVLFVDFILQWFAYKSNQVQFTTKESYRSHIDNHIIPYFEPFNLKLNEVAPKHILHFYNYELVSGRKDGKKGGLSTASIKKHSIILNEVFNYAVSIELINRNPTVSIKVPKNETIEDVQAIFLNADEANKVLKLFEGHCLQPLVYVTLYYGLRRSEVLGVKWGAIDFENDTITINHTVVMNRIIIAKDKTKTPTSKATYQLIPEVKELLLTLKAREAENRKLFGKAYFESDYVFKHEDGTLFRPDYVLKRFKKTLKQNNFPEMRFHDLRHSTASILYDKGWNIKDIQEWLRHADIETTGNIYTHISRSRKQALASDLSNTFRL